MSRPRRFRLDRHLFASNATAYNAAWESYGWTPGLNRARAGRLEERVPWAAELAELADPPVLIGGGGVAGGIGALREAFLPLDGRLGFSVSGVVRTEAVAPPGGRVRIATHTVLFDTELFAAADGYPQGLQVEVGGSLPRVPEPLPELECTPDAALFRATRLGEVDRLARLAGASMGRRDALESLAAGYDAVLRALAGGPGCVVMPGVEGARAVGPGPADLVRLVWLSLPLADRGRVYYSTTWLGGRHPKPCLTVPPHGGRGPEPDRSVVWVRAPENGGRDRSRTETPADERVRAWAELVLGGGRELARVAGRMDVRGMSLGEGRSGPYVVYGTRTARRRAGVVERARVEANGAGRWRGLGGVAAAAVCRMAERRIVSWMEAVLGDRRLARNEAFFDGVVRGLGGRVSGPEAARFGVVAGVRCGRRAAGLALVAEAVRVLAASGAGVDEVGGAIRSVEGRDGHGPAVDMARIAFGILQLSDRIGETATLLGSLPGRISGDPAVIADAVGVARTWLAGNGAPRQGRRQLLRHTWGGAAAVPGCLGVDVLHSLAWLECRARGRITLVDLAAEGVPGTVRLLQVLAGRDPDPPLTVYLALRRALKEEQAA